MTGVLAPFPPVELVDRVGAVGGDLRLYEEIGRRTREEILALLPAGWSFEGKRVLDFGCGAGRTLRHFLDEAVSAEVYGCEIDAPSVAWLEANLSPPLHVFRNEEAPPLPLEADSFDLIWAISVFTHLTDHWAAWLLELHRLLRDGGLVIATILGPELAEEWAPDQRGGDAEADPADRVGMNVMHFDRGWDLGGPAVFHSAWWIREHWGRVFDVLELREDGFIAYPRWRGQGVVLLAKRPGRPTVEELERVDPTELRELAALRHNVCQLHWEKAHELDIERQHRAEAEEDRARQLLVIEDQGRRLGALEAERNDLHAEVAAARTHLAALEEQIRALLGHLRSLQTLAQMVLGTRIYRVLRALGRWKFIERVLDDLPASKSAR